jgi:hypothetical protein
VKPFLSHSGKNIRWRVGEQGVAEYIFVSVGENKRRMEKATQ